MLTSAFDWNKFLFTSHTVFHSKFKVHYSYLKADSLVAYSVFLSLSVFKIVATSVLILTLYLFIPTPASSQRSMYKTLSSETSSSPG